MTTHRLTGAYKAGYTISAHYSLLKIDSSAEVDGAGVFASTRVKIENQGNILAGAGANGGAGHYQGHVGNTGVDLAAGDRVVNFGTIDGGRGGAGFNYHSGGYAGGGGNGGA